MDKPGDVVQRQLVAYNAHDLERFLMEYAEGIQVFRPPSGEPALSGKAAFAAHYAKNRFNLPNLRAQLIHRIICGNTVVDHERITGLGEEAMEVIAVYHVSGNRIEKVWFY